MGSVVADLEQVARLLVSGRGRNLDGLSEDEFAAGQALMSAVSRHAELLSAAWLAASLRRGAHRAAGDLSPEAMFARTQGRSRRDAAREVRMARFLEESPRLREQMIEPGMSTRKASIIAEAMDRLPRGMSAADRSVVEAELVRVAPGMSVEQLSRKARRAVEAVDVELADQIENQQLVRAEAEQAKAATFWMSRPDDAGMVKGGFEIDAVTADMLRAVLVAFLESGTLSVIAAVVAIAELLVWGFFVWRRQRILGAVSEHEPFATELGIAVAMTGRVDEARGVLTRLTSTNGFRVFDRLRAAWSGMHLGSNWISQIGDLPRAKWFFPPSIGITMTSFVAMLWLVPISVLATFFLLVAAIAN